MENLKIRTNGCKECSEKIQKELFRLGYEWTDWGKKIQHRPQALYFYLGYGNEMCVFWRDERGSKQEDVRRYKEVTLQNLQQMETPVMLEVKEDCVWCIINTGNEGICCVDDPASYLIGGEIKPTCHQCKDYATTDKSAEAGQKKKKVVRYYAQIATDGNKWFWSDGNSSAFQITSREPTEPKVCPETNRIYIEVEG